jgi:hypothetical protein
MWMTNYHRFNIKLTQFAELIRLFSHLDIPKKLHARRVMAPREMTPMYILNIRFRAPRIEGILPHFTVLHRMMRTLASRIGNSDTILAYERNLLDALMMFERFDVFDYITDEIWNIAINPLRSCGFAMYIMCMIKTVAKEKFYKDVTHEPLRPSLLKDPRSRGTSPPPAMAPTRATHNSGASSSSNSWFLKMFRGIFALCHRTDQHMDVMEQCLNIVHHNQDTIHSQRDEPLLDFLDMPVYPPVPDPYASLTPTELAAFGLGPSHAPASSDDDEEEANDDEEMEDDG